MTLQNTPGEQPGAPQSDTTPETEGLGSLGGAVTTNGNNVVHCLTIIGQIEGHYTLAENNKTTKYEHVIPQLVAVEQSRDIKGLLIILNTVGGDVEAGLALAELIAGMKKPTVSLVLGGGHSIGVPLACSARHSFIVPTATMTIHPVRMNGLVLGVPQTLSYFEKMQERIMRFVSSNSALPPDRFRQLMLNTGELVMDMGSVLNGEDAVKEGLIDSLGSLADAIAKLDELIEQESEKKNRRKGKETKEAYGKAAGSPPKKARASSRRATERPALS